MVHGIPPTVDIRGAAALMMVHPQTVLDMIARGELPAAQIGRSYVLLTSDVLRFVEEAIVRQTAARMRAPLRPADLGPQGRRGRIRR